MPLRSQTSTSDPRKASEASPDASPDGGYLLYDGECPVCAAYVEFAELRRRHPGLRLLNARNEPELVSDLRGQGYEINDGMVLFVDGQIHYGKAATAKLATYRTGLPVAKRAAIAGIGAAPYAMLRAVRNALLRLRGVGFIK